LKTLRCGLVLVFFASLASTTFAQASKQPSLAPNQTLGFGENQILRFTYKQSFDCVDQPKWDLNFNGIPAASDPSEFQVPICQVGIDPNNDPTGLKGNLQDLTEPLYVLVPLFSVDNDQNPNDAISCDGVVQGTNCGPALGSTLINLFGALPEAYKAKPLVYTQCPAPSDVPGTCTMHTSRIDLGLLLTKLGYLPPPPANYFAPSPNHSHVVLDVDLRTPQIWWQVIPVLVTNASDWPTQDGKSGITSINKLFAAEKAGNAIQAPSNFYLFFASNTMRMH
jgi:hypothetical protein